MLDNYKMEARNGLLVYPQELKEPFLKSPDLVLRDGSRVTASQIWDYMTEEAPRKYPWAFTSNPDNIAYDPYVELLSSIKFHYFSLTRRTRIEALREAGCPTVYVQGGQTVDPYYAAGATPMRPGNLIALASQYFAVDMNEQEKVFRTMDSQEQGNRLVSMEACHSVHTFAELHRGVISVDLLAPYTNLRCADSSYFVESHRDSPHRIPSYLMDYPIRYTPDKPWIEEYVACNIRRLVGEIDKLTGRQTTEEDLRAQIKLHNRIRKIARDFIELWWSAPVPPVGSMFVSHFLRTAHDSDGDPHATEQILGEMLQELNERVKHSVARAVGSSNPVRVFTCGSCYSPNCNTLDRQGAVWIGWDDRWANLSVEVEEEGDPYRSYARAILSSPYELPAKEKAQWVVGEAKKAKADGLIFGYHWGCNYQSAIAGMFCDIVKKEAGIPTLKLQMDDLSRGESTQQTATRIEAFVEMLV